MNGFLLLVRPPLLPFLFLPCQPYSPSSHFPLSLSVLLFVVVYGRDEQTLLVAPSAIRSGVLWRCVALLLDQRGGIVGGDRYGSETSQSSGDSCNIISTE